MLVLTLKQDECIRIQTPGGEILIMPRIGATKQKVAVVAPTEYRVTHTSAEGTRLERGRAPRPPAPSTPPASGLMTKGG